MENWRRSFLNEQDEEGYEDIDGDGWNDGKDNDFGSAEAGKVLFFDKNQIYKKEKYTHGLLSHALKHGKEQSIGLSGELAALIKKFKEILLDAKYSDQEIWAGTSAPEGQPIDKNAITLDDKIVLNTVDRISDDKITNKELRPIEKEIIESNEAKQLAAAYDAKAKEVIKSTSAKRKVADPENPENKVVYADKGILVIIRNKNISSAMQCKGKPEDCINKFATKDRTEADWEIINKKAEKAAAIAAAEAEKKAQDLAAKAEKKAKNAEIKALMLKDIAALKGQGKSNEEIAKVLRDKYGININYAQNILKPNQGRNNKKKKK